MPFDKQGIWFPDAASDNSYKVYKDQQEADKDRERRRKSAELAMAALNVTKAVINRLPRATASTDTKPIQQPNDFNRSKNWGETPIPSQPNNFDRSKNWGEVPKPSSTPKPNDTYVLPKVPLDLTFKNSIKPKPVENKPPIFDYKAMAAMVDDERNHQLSFGKGTMVQEISPVQGANSYSEFLQSTDNAIHDALLKGDTAALMMATMKRQEGLSSLFKEYQKVPKLSKAPEPTFGEKVSETAKNFGQKANTFGANAVQGFADTIPGVSALSKAITGHDTNEMAKEYLTYLDEAKKNPSWGEAMSPQDYFRFNNKLVSDSEASDILRRAGIDQGLAGGAGYFTGSVAGTVASLVGGGSGIVAKGATQLSKVALKSAPKWLKNTLSEVIGAASAGTAYQTQMELTQELTHPEEQSLKGHLADVGSTALYYGAYGVAAPWAQKAMGWAGSKLPQGAKDALAAAEHKAPTLSHVAASTTEGLISGGFVGAGMLGNQLAMTGDPNKAWNALTGEAKSETAENFVESVAYSLLRRGGVPVQVKFGISDNHDPVESIMNRVVNKLSDPEKDDYNEAMKDAEGAGVTRDAAHNIIIDTLSQTEDGKRIISEAVQEEFDSHVENKVATQATVQPEQPQVTQPAAQQQDWQPSAGDRIIIRGKPNLEWTVVEQTGTDTFKIKTDAGGMTIIHRNAIDGLVSARPQLTPEEQAKSDIDAQYKKMREDFIVDQGNWKAPTKLKRLLELRDFADANGLEFSERMQEILTNLTDASAEYTNRQKRSPGESWTDAAKRLTPKELRWELEKMPLNTLRQMRDDLGVDKGGSVHKNVIVSRLLNHLVTQAKATATPAALEAVAEPDVIDKVDVMTPDYNDPVMGAYYLADKLPKPASVYQNRTYSHGLSAFSEGGALTQDRSVDVPKSLKKIDYMLENPTHMISTSDETQPIGHVGVFTKGDVHTVSPSDIDSVRADQRDMKGHEGKRLVHNMSTRSLLINDGEHYKKFQQKIADQNARFDNRAGQRNGSNNIEAIMSPTKVEGMWYRQNTMKPEEQDKFIQYGKDHGLPVWEIADQKELKKTLVYEPEAAGKAAPEQEVNLTAEEKQSEPAKAQATETVDGNISVRAVIKDGKVTVTSKVKNLEHELLPRGFDKDTPQKLSYSFDLADWQKAERSHGNIHYARRHFIEQQINTKALGENLEHHPVISRIMDAQVRAITKAIESQQHPVGDPRLDHLFTITETKHTKTGETLFVVKPKDKLPTEVFTVLKARMSKLGGVYSKFTHGFNFKVNPTERILRDYGFTAEQTKAPEPPKAEKSKKLLSALKESTVDGPVAEDIASAIGDNEQAITNLINRYGNGEIKPLEVGKISVVLDIGNNKVARIGLGQFAKVPDSKLVNQPHAQQMFGPVRVEIYDKLDTKNVTEKDVNTMKQALEKEGLDFYDPTTINLGRDASGVLRVLDPGAVKYAGYDSKTSDYFDAGTKVQWTKDGKEHSGITTGRSKPTDTDETLHEVKIGNSTEWVSSNDGISEVKEPTPKPEQKPTEAPQENKPTGDETVRGEIEVKLKGETVTLHKGEWAAEWNEQKHKYELVQITSVSNSKQTINGKYKGRFAPAHYALSKEQRKAIITWAMDHNQHLNTPDYAWYARNVWWNKNEPNSPYIINVADASDPAAREGQMKLLPSGAITDIEKFRSGQGFNEDDPNLVRIWNIQDLMGQWIDSGKQPYIYGVTDEAPFPELDPFRALDESAGDLEKQKPEKKPTGDNIIDSYGKAIKQIRNFITKDVTLQHLFVNNPNQPEDFLRDIWNKRVTDEILDLAMILGGFNEQDQVKLIKEYSDGNLLQELFDEFMGKQKPKSENGGKADEQTDRVGTDGGPTLEGTPSENVPSPESVGATGTGPVRGPRADQGSGSQSNTSGDGSPGSVGSGSANVDSTPGRGDNAGTGNEPDELGTTGSSVTVKQPSSTNYVITDADDLGIKGAVASFRKNVDAIRLMKKLVEEGRPATEEEQKVLVQYVGWGGIKEPFESAFKLKEEWKGRAAELKELLTPEEYRRVNDTILNAHYTSMDVIRAMYEGLSHLGYDGGGRVLEPSMGVGHFIGMMPRELAKGTRVTGVELDPITGNIAKLIYPQSDVRVMGFEDAKMANDFYDVVIGNVPFGNYAVSDPEYNKSGMTGQIHNYFLAKTMDKVRPGGIVMLITSRYTMDSKTSKVRQYLSAKADLVGAIRLPYTAFKKSANTEVVTDILILKKRPENTLPQNDSWLETNRLPVDQRYYDVNNYFIENPDMVIGKIAATGSMYGGAELTVNPTSEDLQAAIAEAFKKLPASMYVKRDKKATEQANPRDLIPAPGHIKENAFVVHDNGGLYVKQDGQLVPVNVPNATAERIKGMIGIRNAVREYLRLQLEENTTETALTASRNRLNQVYDAFVKKYEPLNKSVNAKAFVDDPDSYLLLSLEHYNKDSGKATKADIFSKRTIERYVQATKADSSKEGLVITLNEKGRVDIGRIAELTGKSLMQVIEDLKGHIFDDPQKGWVTADEYLSGNVKQKLMAAQNALELDPAYKENVDALIDVQPPDLIKEEIDIKLGAHWMPQEYIREFLSHLVGYNANSFKVSYNNTIAEWVIEYKDKFVKDQMKTNTNNNVRWGTPDYYGAELLELALNLREPRVYRTEYRDGSEVRVFDQKATVAARNKQEAIKEEFVKWVWSDAGRTELLVRSYNDRFNTDRLREFDGDHLVFPGMNPNITLKKHQKAAVWRAIQTGNTLLAHAVGAGKTYEMIAAMMEMKRLGMVNKPLWTVPNHLVEQMGADFMKLYPAANILVAGQKDFEAKNRKRLMAKITTGSYDAVIVPHSSFGRISMSYEAVEQFYLQQLEELRRAMEWEAEEGRRSQSGLAKRIAKARKSLEAKMKKKLSAIKKDDNVTFEELGIDGLIVDEAHEFKNLFYMTKMNRVAGLGNQEGSSKAFDLFMKVRYLQRLNGGKGVIFATGTPVSNSLAEMFTFQRYLQYEEMNRRGILNFDSWVSQFGNVKNVLELSPEGKGLRMRTRLTEVVNLAELLHMFRSFADVKTADELLKEGLIKRPDLKDEKRTAVVIPATDALRAFVKTLAIRADLIRTGKVKPDEDNMLNVVGEGRKAALDMRLVDSSAEEHPHSKVNIAAANIAEVFKRTKKYKTASGLSIENGTQLVFLDLSTPKGEKTDSEGNTIQNDEIGNDDISVYNDLRKKLIKHGVPINQIAFIHDYPKDKKEELFRKMNSGEIRILIGSTAKMGAGMNVQKRLAALHHLDVPWRPSDIEQREGRILRQGNDNEEVEIFAYMTEESFDAYMWQIIANKAKVVDQTMSGDLTQRRVEDPSGMEMSANELKALASGDPRIIDLANLDQEVMKLDFKRQNTIDELRNVRFNLERKPAHLNGEKNTLRDYKEDLKRRIDTTGDKFTLAIGKNTYTDREKAGTALMELSATLLEKMSPDSNRKVGQFAGFPIEVRKSSGMMMHGTMNYWLQFNLIGHFQYSFDLSDSALGSVRSMESAIASIESKIKRKEAEIADGELQLAKLKDEEARLSEEVKKLVSEYNEKLAQKLQLEADLNLDSNSQNQEAVVDDSNLDGADAEEYGSHDDTLGLAAPARVSPSANTSTKRPSVRQAKIQSIARLIQPSKLALTPKATEKIADMLTEQIGTIMDKDHVGPRRLGEYDYKGNIGRVKSERFGEWRVIGHEIGHAFDNLMGYIGDDTELRAMYFALYPRPSKKAPVKLQVMEGFAEFFQQWVVDPALARQNAPLTTQKFEEVLLSHPQLKPLFAAIRTIADADLQGTALARFIGGGMVPDIEDDGQTMGANYAIGGLRRAIFAAVDSLIPAKDMAKAAAETGYQNADFLVKLLSITGDAQTKGLSAFEAPMRDKDGTFLHGKSLKSQYQGIVNKIGEAIGWKEVDTSTVDEEVKFLNKTIFKQYKKMGARQIAGAILIAKRVQERRGQGFNVLPMTEEMAAEIMDYANKTFPEAVKAAEQFTIDFSRVVLDKLQNAGILDTKTRQRIEDKSEFYIPFIYDEKKAPTYRRGTKQGGQTYSKAVGHFKGKYLPVLDPIQAILMKLTQVEQAVEYKGVINEIMHLAGHEGMGAFASVIPVSKVATKINMGDVLARIMKTAGIDDKTVGSDGESPFGEDLTTLSDILQGQTMTIFHQDTFKTLTGEPVILNFVEDQNGNMQPVPIKLAPDVFKMIMAMRPIQMNAFMKGLAYVSRGFRFTALATPTYIKNAVSRDLFQGIIQSKNNVGAMAKHTGTSMGVMMGAYLNHQGLSDAEWVKYAEAQYQLFQSSGAASAAAENMLRGMVGSLYDVGMIHTKAPGWSYVIGRGGKKVLVKTLGAPSDLLRFIEEGPRIAEFVSTLKREFKKRGHDPNVMYEKLVKEGTGALPIDLQLEMERILVEATYASGEITTNFRLHGANETIRNYVPTVTFLHGTIQGTARLFRQGRQHPWKTLGYTTVMIGGLSALSWALMMADDDDRKWFQDLPSNMRDKYWWFPNPFMKGTYVNIAKTFDYALFANFGERFLDWKWGGEEQSRNWNADWSSLLSTVTGTDLYSNGLKTVMQMWANKNDFGGDIVPMNERNTLFPWLRYDAATTSLTSSTIAKLYAQLVGDENSFSPRKMDYFIENIFGKWGETGLALSDWMGAFVTTGESRSLFKNKSGPEYNLIYGALVYGQAEGGSPRIIEKFYNDYNGTEQMMGTVKTLLEQENPKLAAKYATDENIQKIILYPAMKKIAEFISHSNKELDAIIQDKTTPASIRAQMTLKKNYIRRLASGVLYRQMPPSPHESIGITQTDIEAIVAEIMWEAEGAQIRERKKKGGPSDIAESLVELKSQ